MFRTRLNYAENAVGLELPAGRIVVFGAVAEDVMALPETADIVCIQPSKPDFDAISKLGFAVAPDADLLEGTFAGALVLVPRARARARLWIAQAAARLDAQGVLFVDGGKTDGIDSLFRACRARLDCVADATKAHGRLFWGKPLDTFPEWLAASSDVIAEEGYHTGPGVFSADHIDPGSLALAAELPEHIGDAVADMGAGWGYLSTRILARDSLKSLDLVESDHIALAAARRNVTDQRARFHWADATSWRPEHPLDAVVMNPPFHTGRAGAPELGQAFIRSASEALHAKGQLWLVANRHLPYEDTLTALFRESGEVGGNSAFKILRATRPRS